MGVLIFSTGVFYSVKNDIVFSFYPPPVGVYLVRSFSICWSGGEGEALPHQ